MGVPPDHRIHLDHAATSHPKPPPVAHAVAEWIRSGGGSPSRGAHGPSLAAGGVVERCRRRLASILGAGDPSRVILTAGTTDGLHLAIQGVVRRHRLAGEPVHVVSTVMEHTSVLRPLEELRAEGVEHDLAGADPRTGRVDPASIEALLRSGTRLVVVQHASNVTGVVQPVREIAAVARAHGAAVVVDAAQTAGVRPVGPAELGADCVVCSGHKGLLGPTGTGALVLGTGAEDRLAVVRTGGTGTDSAVPGAPRTLPERFEAGTPNTAGLAGLEAAADWILERGIDVIAAHERALTARLLERLASVEGLRIVGPGPGEDLDRVAVVSIVIEGLGPAEAAMLLEAEADVIARAGLHCAPLAHERLGTAAGGGTLRLSAGPMLTGDELDRAVDAIERIVAATGGSSVAAGGAPSR